MKQYADVIEHEGVIVDAKDQNVRVSLVDVSVCSSCHAKGACTAANSDEKILDIPNLNQEFSIGERVRVVSEKSLGSKALFFGYLLPFYILLTTLILSSILTKNEALIGFLSLGSLIPYYLGLYLFKNKMQKTFNFKILKSI